MSQRTGEFRKRARDSDKNRWEGENENENENDSDQAESINMPKKVKSLNSVPNVETNDDSIELTKKISLDNKPKRDYIPENNVFEDDDNVNFNELRKIARQSYLTQRESKKIQLLGYELKDFENDIQKIGWENLSKKEQDQYNFKKEIFSIVEKRKELENDGHSNYLLPEDYITKDGKIDNNKKSEILAGKYKDRRMFKDNSNWDEMQMKRAELISHSTRLKKDQPKIGPVYDYVFDSSHSINFISDTPESELDDLNEKFELEEKIREEQKRIKSIEDTRKSLPVYAYRNQLIDSIKKYPVLIIVGETGSGKTTQLPQYLYEAGFSKGGKKIGCTQPRRVAAISVASRVSDEMGTKLGDKVGYSIRFDDKSSDKTVIKYMTDGMLLREFLTDPELLDYSAMMIDEAHERTLHTDILLGLLKDISKYRPDFKLLISSATMNAKKFSDYFDSAPIFNIPGRRFPVEIYYTSQPEANYLHAAITTILQIHISQGSGDILVFLTGQEEIETMAENLTDTCTKLGDQIKELIIAPIYANLPAELQKKIFEPTPKNSRKVVLATNIAETSLTIDGIVYVVDSGFVKENIYNPSTGMESLEVRPCSRASADQRAGRAGRVGPGKCFRLYTKWAYLHELLSNPIPEILRTNLTSVVLMMLSLGITDLIHFDFMDAPPTNTLIKALELLYALGALNENGELTQLGTKMAEFPANPMLSKCLITSGELDCCPEVLSIVAMLEDSSSLFFRTKDKKHLADAAHKKFVSKVGGDHLTLLEIWNQFEENGFSPQWCRDNFIQYKILSRAKNIRNQLERMCLKMGLIDQNRKVVDKDILTLSIMKAITSGFFSNIARLNRNGDSYKTIKKNQQVWIHPSSSMFDVKPPVKMLIYNELVLTSKEFMRNCMPISEKWMNQYAQHYYNNDELNVKKNN